MYKLNYNIMLILYLCNNITNIINILLILSNFQNQIKGKRNYGANILFWSHYHTNQVYTSQHQTKRSCLLLS